MIDVRDLQRRMGQSEVKETPALYLPWTQRVLNPFPLASSSFAWGDMGQPWAITILAWYCSVYVLTTNNATNYWTIALQNASGATLASFTTAAIAVTTWSRFVITSGITQPAASNGALVITATATLSPGAIFIAPALAALRTGN